jgi:hypothetical protein
MIKFPYKKSQRKVSSMYKSILHFIENGLVEIEKMMGDILAGKKDADDLTALVNKVTSTLAVSLIADLYEKADNDIRESSVRKKYWNVEHRNKKKNHRRCHG